MVRGIRPASKKEPDPAESVSTMTAALEAELAGIREELAGLRQSMSADLPGTSS
jgi:hypothetical protein